MYVISFKNGSFLKKLLYTYNKRYSLQLHSLLIYDSLPFGYFIHTP